MMRVYLTRGLLVGLLAGGLAFGFAKIFGEPQVSRAIRVEEQLAKQRGEEMEPDVVRRGVQDTVGLGTGVIAAGAALGGLFSLAFAGIHGRLSRQRARTTAMLTAAGAFMALYLVPFLKYPPNPPSVGNPDTIGHRTVLYFTLIVLGLLATAVGVRLYREVIDRVGAWNAALIGGAAFVIVVAVAYLVMPGVNEVPAAFPAVLLWRFRIASLGIQVVLWGAIGLAFGALTERYETTALAAARQPALAGRAS